MLCFSRVIAKKRAVDKPSVSARKRVKGSKGSKQGSFKGTASVGTGEAFFSGGTASGPPRAGAGAAQPIDEQAAKMMEMLQQDTDK